MGSGIATTTAFRRACLAEIGISCLFFTLSLFRLGFFGVPGPGGGGGGGAP